MAVNCLVTPKGRLGSAGVIAMDVRVAEVTVRLVLAVTVSKLAAIVVVPAATAVTSPLPLTVATAGSDELQAALEVTSSVFPPENEPVAMNCWVCPGGRTKLVGAIARVFGGSVPHATTKKTRSIMADKNLTIFMGTASGTAALTPFFRPLCITIYPRLQFLSNLTPVVFGKRGEDNTRQA